MGKLFTPQDVSSGFNTTNSLNTNFTNIETALDKCLSRTGETPNTMSAALDMNNNNLINAGLVSCDTLEVAGAEVPSLQSLQNLLDTTDSDLSAQVALAQGYATNASQSATDAATAQGLAETAQGLAEDAQAAAEAAASSIDLPILSPGDAGKTLEVNVTEDGYSLITPTEETSAATPSTVVVRDAAGRSQVTDPSVDADIATKGYVDNFTTQGTWVLVGSNSLNKISMSEFPAEYRTPGIFMINGITISVRDTSQNSTGSYSKRGSTDSELTVTYCDYTGSSGEFQAKTITYTSGVSTGLFLSLSHTAYKLVF